MVLQKLSKGNFLNADDVRDHGTKWKILTEPTLEEGKYGQKYQISVQSTKDKEVRVWSMNATSSDYLVDKLGDTEKDWVNQVVELETVNQVIAGEKKVVVYAKGAFEE